MARPTYLEMAVNAATRRLSSMFPGYFQDAKHNHYTDFGYPEYLDFGLLYAIYTRNGLAAAAVQKLAQKTWQDNPELYETEQPRESQLEAQIRQKFADLRLWQKLHDADVMAMVGGYSGVIFRYADGKRFQEPVDRVPGGLDGVVEVIPAWRGQLQVAEWDTDEMSLTYGQPTMFQFIESAIDTSGSVASTTYKTRSFLVHPDRLMVWSRDGSVHARSILEPGYNDLMTMEKISGAGGEGFWKNAKSAPVLSVDKDGDIRSMAEAMGVAPDEVTDAMDAQVSAFQKGFDAVLLLQGMKAETLGVTLPSPEHFFNIALQSFAASVDIPLKVLVGNQTGERASTEDAASFNQTCMSRRTSIAKPSIQMLVNRFESVGILPKRDWTIHWSDLTESSISDKIDRADKMAGINQKMNAGNAFGGEVVFTADEIRESIGMAPLDASAMENNL